MRDRWLTLVAIVGIALLVSPREMHDESVSVASLSLACGPVVVGVECRLLALSREARDPPRSVASVGVVAFQPAARPLNLSQAEDTVQVTGDGDVEIETEYAAKRARVAVRLTANQPGQILGVLRGSVYAYDRGRLEVVADACVELFSGSSPAKQTVSAADGTYELTAVLPGDVEIRVTKPGLLPPELATQVRPGDNRVSPVMSTEPPTGNSAL